MEQKQLTFEALPQATSELQAEVRELKEKLEKFMSKVVVTKPEDLNDPVGIDEACRILGLKKPTVYRKAQRGEIKSYKPKGCKMLMFKRSDLLEWIERSGQGETAVYAEPSAESKTILEKMRQEVRHKPGTLKGGW